MHNKKVILGKKKKQSNHNGNSNKGFSVGKITKKNNSLKECVFVNLALKIQCHVVKNTLQQDYFFGDFAHWV